MADIRGLGEAAAADAGADGCPGWRLSGRERRQNIPGILLCDYRANMKGSHKKSY